MATDRDNSYGALRAEVLNRLGGGAVSLRRRVLRARSVAALAGVLADDFCLAVGLGVLTADLIGRWPSEFATAGVRANCDADRGKLLAEGEARVQAGGTVFCIARGLSAVEARDCAAVQAYDCAAVRARDHAIVSAYDGATVDARGSVLVHGYGRSRITAHERVKVHAHEEARVRADGRSRVTRYDGNVVMSSGEVVIIDS